MLGAGRRFGEDTEVWFERARSAPFELWRSNGEHQGTWLVRRGLFMHDSYSWAGHDGLIYLPLANGTQGIELWRSDGTPEATWMVKDIRR